MSGTFSNVSPTFPKAARLVRAGLLVVMLGCLAGAAFGQPGMFQIESSSKQFVVLGPPGVSTPMMSPIGQPSKDLIRLDPSLVAISSERVKAALLKALGQQDRWGGFAGAGFSVVAPGRVYLRLSPQQGDQIAVVRNRVPQGWNYSIQLPLQMDRNRFITLIAQVLLVDLCNPGRNESALDLPSWLTEGLIAHLKSSASEELVLEASTSVNLPRTGTDSIRPLRELFQKRSPLSFEELSWPSSVSAERGGLFVPSSELFVYELLRMDGGRDALRRMIGDIGRFRNWQFAFFESFQRRFKQPADVEKWWAVQVAAVTGRNPVQLLTPAQSLSRLEEVLSVPVVIQQTSNSLPQAAHVTLRQVVTDWDFNRENPALRRMHDDLAGLRYRAAPELIRLIENYRAGIEQYLQEREPRMLYDARQRTPLSTAALNKAMLRRLDELEADRAEARRVLYSSFANSEAERRSAMTNALNTARPDSRPRP